MASQEYQMILIENDGMKFLEKIKMSEWFEQKQALLVKITEKIKLMRMKNPKWTVTQVIDYIGYFIFYTVFIMGCAAVITVIGIMWLIDQVIGKWEK